MGLWPHGTYHPADMPPFDHETHATQGRYASHRQLIAEFRSKEILEKTGEFF